MSTESVNSYEETNESPEHVEAMLEKAEALENAGTPRPEWLPEKFDSPEQMADSYRELERKLSSGDSTTETTEEVEEVEETEQLTSQQEDPEVAQVVKNAGLDFDDLQSRYLENGEIAEADYEALEKAGLPKSLVDAWIDGQEALVAAQNQNIFNIVGGEAQYQEMIGWASENLSEVEIAGFNKAIDSGDGDVISLAVEGLNSKYQAVEGRSPTLVQGQSTNSTGGGFNSVAELTAAMADPRYDRDSAYRQEVAAKLSRSNVL